MPNQLTNLKVHEVSGVDKAANGKKFLVVKRAGDNEPEHENPIKKAFKALAKALDFNGALAEDQKQQADWEAESTLYDGIWALRDSIDSIRQDDTITDKVSAAVQSVMQFVTFLQNNAVIKAGKKISGERMGKLKDLHSQLGDLITGADDDQEPEGTEDDNKGADNVAKGKFPDGHPEGCMCDTCKGAREDVAKSLETAKGQIPEEFVKRVESLEKRNSDLEAELKKRDEQAKEDAIRKSLSGLAIGVNVDDMLPVLKSVYGTEAYDKMLTTLKAADEQVKKGNLFKESGRDGVVESNVEKQVQAQAAEIQKRDGCTKEQAITKALHENPGLYTEWKKEGVK